MFLIYINDLPRLDLSSKVILYADDLVLYHSDLDWNSNYRNLQNDLFKILSWTYYNRLTINYSKSKFQILGNRSKLSKLNHVREITVGIHTLGRVDNYNYLGIDIDSELKFEKAPSSAYARYSYRLYSLSIIRENITRRAAVAIVKSMLMPYFDYMLFLINTCSDKSKTKALVW